MIASARVFSVVINTTITLEQTIADSSVKLLEIEMSRIALRLC